MGIAMTDRVNGVNGGTKGTIGYYRYTDVQFEWCGTLMETWPDRNESSSLKAFFSPKALVSPDCPLHPGKSDIDLSIVVFPTGESKLCFSSQQVEYARYWLHAMGLTKEMLPLPNSSYLLPRDKMSSVSPISYNTVRELKHAERDMSRNNKRIAKAPGTLPDLRADFERVRDAFQTHKGIWTAVDFEAWEYESDRTITEFGFASLTWNADGSEKRDEGHWTVKEHNKLRNGKFVGTADNRDHYLFGETEQLRKAAFYSRVCEFVKDQAHPGPLFLVFHSAGNDLNYFKLCGVPLETVEKRLPSSPPIPVSTEAGDTLPPIYLVDTQKLFKGLEGHVNMDRALERMCGLLGIKDTQKLHNAGNDAHYTLQALESMASGEHVDKQRVRRWPGKEAPPLVPGKTDGSVNRLAVQWGDEDASDWESDEAIM